MNSTKEKYAEVGRIAYLINEAHKVGKYDKHVTITFEDRDIVTLVVLQGNRPDRAISTSNIDKVLETAELYLKEAEGVLSTTNERRKDAISRMVAVARDHAISHGFDLAQEAWDNIFNECMENFKELEEM